MKKLLPIIIVSLSLLAFRLQAEWVKYVSKEGHYTIEFPGKPSESNEQDTADGSARMAIHYAAYFPNDSTGYMTDWIDLGSSYPKDKTLKQILEDSRNGALKSFSGAKVYTTATFMGKEPYIEFSFTSADFTGRGRIYIINKFQYVVMTLFPLASGISPDADRFIKSFKHTK